VITRRRLLRNSLATLSACELASCGLLPGRDVPGKLLESGASLGHALRDGQLPAPMATRKARVVIVGGGIAGLAAARTLRRRGVEDVLVIDVLEQVGGNSSYGANSVSRYPWGAHYVPLVRADCRPVLDLFADLKIIVDEDGAGRPVYDEFCLSADPQERLWMYGRWVDGLVPQLGSSSADEAEFAAFFALVERLKSQVGSDGRPLFAIPVDASSRDVEWRALDSILFSKYLRSQGFRSQRLLWYLNYCCRDDYGATADAVSAWAGLHYFAGRNGVAANASPSSVLTWPEGNGHLVREMVRQGAPELQCKSVVTRVATAPGGVAVDYFDAVAQRSVRVEAAAAIVCLPHFIASRVVEGLSPASAKSFSYAPWMVANLTLGRLPAGAGQALAWDNVIYGSESLGYVVATHQDLRVHRTETVITYYWPLSGLEPQAARKAAWDRSLGDWQALILGDLLRVHPELKHQVLNIDVRVWGHAMIRPVPGFIWGEERSRASMDQPPVFFAHSDLGGISIFEEAYCRGDAAGRHAARYLDGRA
jgi:phytoene dehydrogenase-like protein